MTELPHVVILGAGFGGLGAAHRLSDAPVRITIVDRHDYQTFQPLLYQVATDELDQAEVGYPVRELLHTHQNVTFHKAVVRSVDLAKRQVEAEGVPPMTFDYLILGLGSLVSFHDTPGAADHTLPLYTLSDASRLHDHLLQTLENADKDPKLVDEGALNFCIVGGGPTGTETAGAISELLHAELVKDFPHLPLEKVRIILFQHGPDLLPMFVPKLRAYAQRALKERGVEVRTNCSVKEVTSNGLVLASGEVVKSSTVIWTAGSRANPIAASLGLPLSHGGKLAVGPTLQLSDHPEVFVVGDMAAATDVKTGKPLPALAAVALQAGTYVGDAIRRLNEGRPLEPFVYHDKGTMAQIGRGAAVVQLPNGSTLTGRTAWLAWLGVHLCLLSGAERKTTVFVEWGWNLLTRRRGKRIIFTDEDVEQHASQSHGD